MQVIKPGHTYLLDMLDLPEDRQNSKQSLWFVMREGEGYPGNFGTQPGTTTQEVLRALIERNEYVNNQVPCAETEAAGELLKAALLLYELRAARRHARLSPEFETLTEAVTEKGCDICGHIGCEDHTCEGERHVTD
jgi:hypothetical protein